MKYVFPLALFLFSILLYSCGPQVVTAQPTEADLSSYKTFAYLPNSSVAMNKEDMNDEEVNNRIIETVNLQMEKQGYTLDRSNPDLLVLISVKTDTETEVQSDPVYARYPYGTYGVNTVSPYYSNYSYNNFYSYGNVIGYDTDTYQYQEGTLIISLVDRQSRNIVWKGMTSEAIYSGSTTDEVVTLVDDIFQEYPVKRGAK